jgi:magnesium-transporting ATPase (P-type)
MILDNYLSYNIKVYIAIICSGLWIYFRTSDCYKMIPRAHIFPVFFVMIWCYLNYYEPLFLPIGLLILIAYSEVLSKVFKNLGV